ncbi:MAG: universal stress protein [Bacteroidales bacterium]|nr:universal stress protein [Bacteroidales bacterium]
MKKDTRNVILIPTDFSEVCENAIKHGLILAKAMKSNVWLLHVINKDTNKFLDEKNLEEGNIEEMLKESAEKYSKEYGIPVETFISSGNIFEKIKEVSDKLGAKLIILGTHGKIGFQKIAGSYVLKVITTTGTPTIVVQKESNTAGYKNIVFPITSSTQDRQKVAWAVSIAKVFGATVHLIPKFESEKFHRNRIMTVTKQIKDIMKDYGIKFVDKVSSPEAGNFAKQVIDYSVENKADLIMTLVDKDKTFFFSSWDEQIIYNSSQIPVICINPVATKKTAWDKGW